MTAKRFIRNIVGQVYDIKNDKFFQEDYNGKPIGYEDDLVECLNALHEDLETHKQYCKTLGIGINKIMQSIKDNKEDKALVMCLTLLKKLEEEDLLE